MSAASDLTLRIEHDSGGTSTLVVPTPVAIDEDKVTLAQIRVDEALDKVGRCEAVVFRDAWLTVLEDVDRRNDQFFVEDADGEDIFGGRLDDWQFEGTLVSVLIDSFEADTLGAEPPPSESYSATTDDAIVSDILSLVDAPISAGTIEQTNASIDYSATHLAPGAMLRQLGGSTGAELAYRPDGTVDYLGRRGTDRSETISPSTGAIVSDPRIRRTIREEPTHVRVVSESDSTIFEESVVDSTGREVWHIDRIDSTSSSRIQARATTLANEFSSNPNYLEVEATLDPSQLTTAPQLGDRYPLSLPAYGVDAQVRVIERERIIKEDGDLVDVLLSNRLLTLRNR